MEFPFKVGDELIVKPGVRDYTSTTPGSIGKITEIYDSYFKVNFSLITGYTYSITKYSFSIYEHSNFSLLNSSSIPPDSKYYKVLAKIEQLKQRRKEQGYAY